MTHTTENGLWPRVGMERGFPGGASGKEHACQCRRCKRHGFYPKVGNIHPLVEGMATHSSILAWRIPWIEEPGGLRSMGLQRVRHDWNNLARTCSGTQSHSLKSTAYYSFLHSFIHSINMCLFYFLLTSLLAFTLAFVQSNPVPPPQ